MKSKRSHEGYLLLDNSVNQGVPEALVHQAGFPVGAARGKFECATITCSHCQTVLIVNPLRTRPRAWCSKCDHYLCDACGMALHQTGVCRTFKQVAEEVVEAAVKAEQRGGSNIIIPS